MTLDDAKERLRIPELWAILQLPGDCRKNPCHSPFYEQVSKAAFSVFDDGRAFNDLRTGDGGSAIDFLILATGLSRDAACRKFLELAGGGSHEARPVPKRTAPAPQTAQARQKPAFPDFERGTDDDLHGLAELRHVSFFALHMARHVGLLRFAEWHGQRAWIITDDERLNAQARRPAGSMANRGRISARRRKRFPARGHRGPWVRRPARLIRHSCFARAAPTCSRRFTSSLGMGVK